MGQHAIQPSEPISRRDPRRTHACARERRTARSPAVTACDRAAGEAAPARPWKPLATTWVESALRRGRSSFDKKSLGAAGLGLKAGDDVVHAKWGEGVILELNGEGDDTEAVIRFPSVGEKRLLLTS